MSSDLDVIKAIVNAFDRSDWAEIDVRSGSMRIRLSTQPQTVADSASAILDGPPAAQPAADPGDDATPDTGGGAVVIPAGARAVLSPSPGIFWRSPHPGAPPFAALGDNIESGRTLGIVEVMKLMNHISSDIPGTVIGVFVDDGMRVARGDVLFAVQPSGVS